MENNKTENRIQQEMVLWFNKTFPNERGMLFHVANEQQHHKIGIGVVAGVSDLILLRNKTAYFIEVKTPIGRQSPKQKRWQAKVEAQGYEYFIVRNLDEFKKIIS